MKRILVRSEWLKNFEQSQSNLSPGWNVSLGRRSDGYSTKHNGVNGTTRAEIQTETRHVISPSMKRFYILLGNRNNPF